MVAKKPTKQIVLQERDLLLIRMLAEEFRLLSREQIGELLPMGSVTRLNFRLKQLREAGYLSRRSLSEIGGVVKYAYYLGPRAAELFDDPTERRVVEGMRAQASQLSSAGLAHRMLVDSIHIRFLIAGRDYPAYKLMTWVDQYSSWWEEVRAYGVPIQADGYGEYLMLMNFDSLFTFFLEVDRGNERGEAVQDKITRYLEFAESGVYERQFAAPHFRVLVVATSERRAKRLLTQIASQTDKLFWVTSWERFRKAKLFDRYWKRPRCKGLYSLADHV